MSDNTSTSYKRAAIGIAAALIFVAGAAVYTLSQMGPSGGRPGGPPGAPASGAPGSAAASNQNAANNQNPAAGQARKADLAAASSTRVVQARRGTYQASLSGYGSAESHYELALTARVGGVVESLSASFESGELIKKGSLLAQLENSSYLAAVAAAEQSVADAKVTLLEEEREVEQAQTEWKAAGLSGDPDSPLLLREPQLAAARAALKNAEAELVSARKELQWTRLTAPFDALVVTRDLMPGAYVSAGGAVATLYSTDKVEIAVALSEREWAMLPSEAEMQKQHWPVVLTSVESRGQWQGYVSRVEKHLDEETRQRSLIVAVDAPLQQTPALQPGTFVKMTIEGKPVDNVWKLPTSALSQRGYIWYLNEQQQLQSQLADVLFSDARSIYVQVPEGLADEQLVVMQPLSSYAEGALVSPRIVADGDSGLIKDSSDGAAN